MDLGHKSAASPDLMHSVHERKVQQVGHVAGLHCVAVGCSGVDGCTEQLPRQAGPLLVLFWQLVTRMWLALHT